MDIPKKIKKIVLRDYFTDHPRVYRRFGALWLLRYRNHIDRKLILGERYEDAQLEYCTALISEQNITTLIDVGANFGLYSITLALQSPSLRSIVAFEPDPRNFNHLAANIYLNTLDTRIDARPVGISNRKDSLHFLCNKGHSTGTSRLTETAPTGTNPDSFLEILIPVDTLDAQLETLSATTALLKIDVEGHEKKVIKGRLAVLGRNRCFVQMEILDAGPEMIAWMATQAGFRCFHNIGNDYYFRND